MPQRAATGHQSDYGWHSPPGGEIACQRVAEGGCEGFELDEPVDPIDALGRAVALLLAIGDEGVQGIGRALQDWAVANGDLAGHLGIENEQPVGPVRRDRSQKSDGDRVSHAPFRPPTQPRMGLTRRIFLRGKAPGFQVD